MSAGGGARTRRVLLIVPPFHQVVIPSLGVSLLKAALGRLGIPCDVLYLNLRYAEAIGPELYTSIAAEGRFQALAGEWVFAGDLFGERAPDPARYLDEVLLGRFPDVYDRAATARLAELRAGASAFLDGVMEQVAWQDYALVGVSSTFQQNCAGLALLKRIRAKHPDIATAMGGANCEGPMGAAIHELFPFVDYVCSGEGDRVFPRLVQAVLEGRPVGGLPGIYARGELSQLGDETRAPLVLDLDRLPYPDYDDYFSQFQASGLARVETPTLALETSRGCWWGEKHHCTFCGLNGGGMQYRGKSPERALAEIDHLVQCYGVRKLYAIDNILDFRYFDSLLKALAERPRPPRLYYETKANLSKDQLRRLARAGVWGIQPGIESLSTPILRLMNKGVSGLQNVRLLKWCLEIGIQADWTVLCGFPGEEPAEYERLADLVPSLTHLPPPFGLYPIRLDRFSPYFAAPEANGMVNVRPASAYGRVYPFAPNDLGRLAYYFDFDYADGRDPATYTGRLKSAISDWRAQRATARLELRDDGERLELADARPRAARDLTILAGSARLAYLALDAGQTAAGVQARLARTLGQAAPDLARVQCWLDRWLADRLVLREGERYLSLATNFAERVELPVERFLATLAGGAR